MSERIVGVAVIREDGSIASLPAPNRHYHILHSLPPNEARSRGNASQGFVTDTGRYVGREEAGRIADTNGQAKRTPGSRVGGMLFSEDLW